MDHVPAAFSVTPAAGDLDGMIAFEAENVPDPVSGLKKPLPQGFVYHPIRLAISDESFDIDYVEQSGPFCSSITRELFDLPAGTVQYFPVDTSGSSAPVREKDFKLIRVLAYRSAIDLDRSELWRVSFDERGLPAPERIIAVKSVVFKEDFESDVPLFHDPHDQRLFATDEFAERVLEAGIKGISFIDVTDRASPPGHVRTKELAH
jgi:hypothetical protein